MIDSVLSANNRVIGKMLEDVFSSFYLSRVYNLENGFDFLLYVPRIKSYVGVSLTNDLKLLRLANFDCYMSQYRTLDWDTSYLDGCSDSNDIKFTSYYASDYASDLSPIANALYAIYDRVYMTEKVFEIESGDKKFKLMLDCWYHDYGEKDNLVLLSVNDKPVVFLDNKVISGCETYFRLLKVTGTNLGYDLEFTLPDTTVFFKVSLSKDLELLEITGLKDCVNTEVNDGMLELIKSEEFMKLVDLRSLASSMSKKVAEITKDVPES